jgi:hypothetical protein
MPSQTLDEESKEGATAITRDPAVAQDHMPISTSRSLDTSDRGDYRALGATND